MDKSQYKDVCVFVEQREGIIQKVALELLGKARELADTLNEKVIALLLGYDMKDQAQELIAYGADIVVCVDERELAVFGTMFSGAFGSSRKIWILGQNLAVLLCISLAVWPQKTHG